MSWYSYDGNRWTEQDTPPTNAFAVQVVANNNQTPDIRFLTHGQECFLLSGTTPREDTDTTHQVARIDPETSTGVPLFTIHADGSDLIFEDRRPPDRETGLAASALEHVQSSLNEILIPVYIDDVISDLSDKAAGLLVIHTAQYEDRDPTSWTYFRTAMFEQGNLVLEEEHGEL